MKKVINTTNAPAPIGPYNQAILANDTLYVSGQIAIDPQSGNLIDTGVSDEARQVMKNLQAVLDAAAMDFSNVVKTSIFLQNMDDFSVVNEIYGSYFEFDPPARETVQVARLPKDVNVEISCIAVR
jgi:2-iminobutanoate/2-iminopropanoate deaminase